MRPKSSEPRGGLDEFSARLKLAQEPFIEELQRLLDGLEGKSFGTFEENQAATAMMAGLMNRLGLLIVCPKDGCGEPATLLCHQGKRCKAGAYSFSHIDPTTGRQVMHLGTTRLPRLRLVTATKGQRRKHRRDIAPIKT